MLRRCACKRFTIWQALALLVATYGISVALAVATAAAEGGVTPTAVQAGLWDGAVNAMLVGALAVGVLAGRATRRMTG